MKRSNTFTINTIVQSHMDLQPAGTFGFFEMGGV